MRYAADPAGGSEYGAQPAPDCTSMPLQSAVTIQSHHQASQQTPDQSLLHLLDTISRIYITRRSSTVCSDMLVGYI